MHISAGGSDFVLSHAEIEAFYGFRAAILQELDQTYSLLLADDVPPLGRPPAK